MLYPAQYGIIFMFFLQKYRKYSRELKKTSSVIELFSEINILFTKDISIIEYIFYRFLFVRYKY